MNRTLFYYLLVLFTMPGMISVAQKNKKAKVLFVLTSHNTLGNTGRPTGFWIEEFATPYYYFADRGVDVVVATPKGGPAPIDPKSNEPAFQTEATKRYFKDPATQKVLSSTVKLSTVEENDFDAVFYPGGHGPMWDLANDKNSIRLIQAFYGHNKPVAFVCHGPAALVNVKDRSGNYLISGKRLTSFCNTEEEAVQLSGVVPFPLESRLKERGAIYVKAADWSSFALEDGNFITGQNPQSSELVAEKLYARIKNK
ncbi:type 1 glutamine amidotransferase domain-containing protein [Flavihumibacter stibioxidans]|nr:type 1 glutamine amidotransferase domain-containing protein [Flavihumibacter stibioxidans]